MQKKPADPHPIILNTLTRGTWHTPHEVNLQLKLQGCHVAAEACTARMRDLRKQKYGGYTLIKRRRVGTDYFEHRIERQESKAA